MSKRQTSKAIFLSAITRDDDDLVDVTPMFTKDSFLKWMESRGQTPKVPHRAFQSAIRNIVTGCNGAKPFEPEIESAVLSYLRSNSPQGWPCFETSSCKRRHGMNGWKNIVGHHENRYFSKQSSSCSSIGKEIFSATFPNSPQDSVAAGKRKYSNYMQDSEDSGEHTSMGSGGMPLPTKKFKDEDLLDLLIKSQVQTSSSIVFEYLMESRGALNKSSLTESIQNYLRPGTLVNEYIVANRQHELAVEHLRTFQNRRVSSPLITNT